MIDPFGRKPSIHVFSTRPMRQGPYVANTSETIR